MFLTATQQTLQIVARLLALFEISIGLYVLLLNARRRANRAMAASLLLIATNSFVLGQLISAEDYATARPLTLILSATFLALTPSLLLTALALLKDGWVARQRRLRRLLYGLLVLPALLTLTDQLVGTQLWYSDFDPVHYSGGFISTEIYLQGLLAPLGKVLYLQILQVALLALLVYVAWFEKQIAIITRHLARLLLVANIIALGMHTLIPAPLCYLLAEAALVFIYAYIAFRQTALEHRWQQGQLQNRLTMLIFVVLTPLLAGLLLLVVTQFNMLLQHILPPTEATALLVQQTMAQLQQDAVISLVVGVSLILGLTWLTVRQTLRPITTLTTTAMAIAEGDLSQIASVESDDEIGALASAFNIMTRRLRAMITELEQRVRERTRSLETALDETQALYRLSRALVAPQELCVLLSTVVEVVAETLPADRVLLITFDLEAQRVIDCVGNETGRVPIVPTPFEELHEGLSGWVLRERQPALSSKNAPDPRESPSVQRRRSENGGGSIIVAPLQYREQLLGTITAINHIDDPDFTQRDVDLLMVMANQTAAAVQNTRLYAQTQAALTETQALYQVARSLIAQESLPTLLQAIAEQVAIALPADRVLLVTLDFQHRCVTHHVTGGAGRKIPPPLFDELMEGLTGWAVRQRQPAISPKDEDDPRESPLTLERRHEEIPTGAILVVPLIYRDQPLGTLTAINRPDQPNFTPRDAELMSTMANQAAMAIENMRLIEELEAEVKARTAEIRAEQEKSTAILENAGDAILVADADMRVRYINPAYTRLVGYMLEEIDGQSAESVGVGIRSTELAQSIRNALTKQETWKGEALGVHKNGHTYDAALTIAPMYNPTGDLTGYVCSHQDISERKRLQRAREEFLTNVSHQLRTPVTTLNLYLHLLGQNPLTSKAKQQLQQAKEETSRLIHLMEDILEITALDSQQPLPVPQPIDLPCLMQDLFIRYAATAEKADLDLILSPLPPELPAVHGNTYRLHQALGEIVENAITFTPAGGQINLSVAVRQDNDQHWLTITVRDTGPGIAPNEMPHLFERFFRGQIAAESGHIPGTGLGLCIAQAIIKIHQGRLTVASSVGEGTAFTAWLPLK